MIIRDLFEKPVDRFIEGVIQADGKKYLMDEVNEYVITRDIGKKLYDIVEPYSMEPNVNGVWISGFFGSGKSHLLKMLSLALNHRIVDGVDLSEIFLNKVRETEDEILIGDMEMSLNIPSENILFNIDQRADATFQYTDNRLLGVFLKVFNEHCGFCSSLPFIAEFERDMEEEGILQKLKEAYKEDHGEIWEEQHHRFHLIRIGKFAETYSRVTGVSQTEGKELLLRYRNSFGISIEDFAEKVSSYINKKPENFRFNFFVDEVGQFIAESTQRMLNLQSIAETLNTKCGGRSWLFVTSQAQLDDIFGSAPGEDFGRIQDRFNVKVNLDGKDVSEVIQLRLLKKKHEEVSNLIQTYEAEEQNIRTLFSFGEGTQTYQRFRNSDDFAKTHPFIPYQYDLFQQAMTGLARHGAFTSRHTSVGERSMLGVFQDVLKEIADLRVGNLATFDKMFQGVRQALKPGYLNLINQAENNLGHEPLAIRLLHAMALVKYVDSFKPTASNLTILLIDSFDLSVAEFQRNVEQALQLLEQEIYVQRNGENFSYLTYVEQEIENDIRATEISASDQIKLLSEIIFSEIVQVKQFVFDDNGQNYPFARKLDGALALGQDSELALNLASPFNENAGNDYVIRSHSVGKSELLIILPDDKDLMSDLSMFLKTDRYSRTQAREQADENIHIILRDKDNANQLRRRNIRQRVEELLQKATLVVSNNELTITGDVRTRLEEGFQELVRGTYPNLKMLKGHKVYDETDLQKILFEDLIDLFGGGEGSLTEAEQEILNQIRNRYSSGETTSVRDLENTLTKKPYGWPAITVKCLLCRIHRRGMLDIRVAGNSLDENKILQKLPQTGQASQIMLSLQADVDPAKLQKLKLFHHDFFKQPNPHAEIRGVFRDFRSQLDEMIKDFKELYSQHTSHPFLVCLEPHLQKLKDLKNQGDSEFLNHIQDLSETYLNLADQELYPVQSFMKGPQFKVYCEVIDYWKLHKDDILELPNAETSAIESLEKSKKPWSDTQKAKACLETLKLDLGEIRKTTLEAALSELEKLKGELRYQQKFQKLNEEQQEKLLKPFDNLKIQLEDILSPTTIDSRKNYARDTLLVMQLNELNSIKIDDDDEVSEDKLSISSREIKIEYSSTIISNEEQLDEYLSEIRGSFLRILQQNKKIILSKSV